jgi:arabinogalactan oligomer/maltooligosaccharide transport system permease protein
MQTSDNYTLGAGLQQFVPQFSPRWELLTAGAVLITIPAAIVFFFAQKHLVAGLTAGGTKG